MRTSAPRYWFVLAAMLAMLLAGCGQMGPLVQRSSLEDASETSAANSDEDEDADEDER